MTNPIYTGPTGLSKPEGVTTVHAGSMQGGPDVDPSNQPTELGLVGQACWGIWPDGLIRSLTSTEIVMWGIDSKKPKSNSPVRCDPAKCDRVLANDHAGDREFQMLASYDQALRTGPFANVI